MPALYSAFTTAENASWYTGKRLKNVTVQEYSGPDMSSHTSSKLKACREPNLTLHHDYFGF